MPSILAYDLVFVWYLRTYVFIGFSVGRCCSRGLFFCLALFFAQIPRTFELLEEGFTKENNMQTQKLSTKRHVVIKHYNDTLMHMYGDRPHQVQEEAA